MPGIKPTGTNTAAKMSAIAMTGAEISRMASSVASSGLMSRSFMLCSTASTTTMASSTTMPMASTKPNSVSVLMVKPSGIKNVNVPTIDTGMASTGMSVERQLCRNRNTTTTTSSRASSSVCTTSLMDTFTTLAASKGTM